MSQPPSVLVPGCIQANPDIAGIGVRIAIYAQNFIALISALVALGDRYVSWKELVLTESQSMTLLLTACALLLSAVIQAATFGMSTYHSLIVLNLAWMNTTNTLLYAVLFRYQGAVKIPGFRLSSHSQTLSPLPKRKAIPLLTIGALHLSFVAALGFWLWLKIDTFGTRSQCAPQLPLFLVVLSHRLSINSRALRSIFLAIYGICAIPGFNLVIIVGVVYGPTALCAWTMEKLLLIPKNVAFFLPGYITLILLAAINITIAIDTEIMIHQTRPFLQAGESQWTFGQTLAIFMLVLPLKDITFAIFGEDEQLSKTRERIDEERAVYRQNWRKWLNFVPKRNWPNVNWPNVQPVVPAPVADNSTETTTFRSFSSSSIGNYCRYGKEKLTSSTRVGTIQPTLPIHTCTPHQLPLSYPIHFSVVPSAVYSLQEPVDYPIRVSRN